MLHFRSSDIGMFGRRQRHARGHRIPVSIVRSSSAARRDRDTSLVADSFGADEMLLPGMGCRCCTIRPKLQNALRGLLAERKQGRHFTRVVIETNGNPGPILRTFVTERALGAAFYVEEAPVLSAADGVDNFALTEDAPLSWDAFSRFITTFTALRGADLLHVKGLLNVEGSSAVN